MDHESNLRASWDALGGSAVGDNAYQIKVNLDLDVDSLQAPWLGFFDYINLMKKSITCVALTHEWIGWDIKGRVYPTIKVQNMHLTSSKCLYSHFMVKRKSCQNHCIKRRLSLKILTLVFVFTLTVLRLFYRTESITHTQASSLDFHKIGGESNLQEMCFTGEAGDTKVRKVVGDLPHCSLSMNFPCWSNSQKGRGFLFWALFVSQLPIGHHTLLAEKRSGVGLIQSAMSSFLVKEASKQR